MRKFIKGKTHLNAPQELILVRLLVTMGAATIVATSSLYLLDLGMTPGQIGIATSAVVFINLIFAVSLPAILESVNLGKILLGSTLSFGLTLIIFGQVKNALFALFVYIIGRLLLSLFASAYSVLFRDDSDSKKSYNKNQALSSSLINFSWMITPFFATLIVDNYSFAFLYVCGGLIVFAAAIILITQKIPVPVKKRKSIDNNIIKNIIFYFSQKRLKDVYFLSAGVNIWWSFIFVFMTIILKENGFSNSEIGLYLTITQLPLFLFEFKTFKVVEKFRYKKPFTLAYSFLTIVLIGNLVFGIASPVSLVLILLGSLSMVFIEPAREMYLYEKIKPVDEEKVQPVYATAELAGGILARLVLGLILVFINQIFAFICMAAIMLFIATSAYRMEN